MILQKNCRRAALAEKFHALINFPADLNVVRTTEDGTVVVLNNQFGDLVRTNAVEVHVQKFQAVMRAIIMRVDAINQEHVALAD